MSQRKIANECNIHVAYFSRVIKGDLGANFSEDQIFSICNALNITKEEEINYILLLLQFERSGDRKYKEFLKTKINKIRETKLSIKDRIDDATTIKEKIFAIDEDIELKYKYFQKWYYTEVYLLLSIDQFRQNISLIAEHLKLPKEFIVEIISDLEEMGLVEQSENNIKYIQKVIHMGEKHFLATNHHLNWRAKAIEDINTQNKGWHFTVGISTNKKTKEDIRKRFKDFIHEIYLLTRETKKNEDTYHICVDLF